MLFGVTSYPLKESETYCKAATVFLSPARHLQPSKIPRHLPADAMLLHWATHLAEPCDIAKGDFEGSKALHLQIRSKPYRHRKHMCA